MSIRFKLAGLLTVVALAPLLAALVGLVIGTTRLRSETMGQSILSVAIADVRGMEVSLVKDIEKLQVALQDQTVLDLLRKADKELPPAVRQDLDRRWPTMRETDEPLRTILTNPVALRMKLIQDIDPRIEKILVTDRFGQAVASTIKTDDFYQADEDWWQGAAPGPGRWLIHIPPIAPDPSTHQWSINLVIPVVDKGRLVGVVKAVLNVSRWMKDISTAVGDYPAEAMLVREDGMIIDRPGLEPLTRKADFWYGAIADGRSRSWRITPDGEIQAFAPIQMPRQVGGYDVKSSAWQLVLYIPESTVLGPLYDLGWTMLAVGLGIIAVIFVGGVFLVEKGIVRRIKRLERATDLVSQGQLGHRVQAGVRAGFFGGDEIDELARDFDQMIERLQRSYQELAEANQLKTNFIRIASHELRTPVSYILGMARLLRDCDDPRKLSQAVGSIAAKARRLEEIIQAMFKLMPEERYTRELRYEEVSLRELMEELRQDCRPFVEQRGQKLLVEVAPSVGPVLADRWKLRDMVENLLMNAIKFTPDGGTVTVSVGRELSGSVRISVQDQGPGIPQEELPHLFQPFYSGADVMKHSTGTVEHQKRGMGLGLAIVRHFARLHGGTVSVQTSAGGSVFTVSIPSAPTQAQGQPEGSGVDWND
jgi:signal transduction histidine kinase